MVPQQPQTNHVGTHAIVIGGPFMSWPFLEWLIRRRVLGLQNLEYIHDCHAKGLIASDDRTRITGVEIQRRPEGANEERLAADLIVDATGRRSHVPGGRGAEAPGTGLINWYVGKIHRASTHDSEVYRAFLGVMNLIDPLPTLFAPRIMLRVLSSNLSRRGKIVPSVSSTIKERSYLR